MFPLTDARTAGVSTFSASTITLSKRISSRKLRSTHDASCRTWESTGIKSWTSSTSSFQNTRPRELATHMANDNNKKSKGRVPIAFPILKQNISAWYKHGEWKQPTTNILLDLCLYMKINHIFAVFFGCSRWRRLEIRSEIWYENLVKVTRKSSNYNIPDRILRGPKTS